VVFLSFKKVSGFFVNGLFHPCLFFAFNGRSTHPSLCPGSGKTGWPLFAAIKFMHGVKGTSPTSILSSTNGFGAKMACDLYNQRRIKMFRPFHKIFVPIL
jgi:hypothetical protein